MKAIVSVLGKDKKGIIAEVSTILAQQKVNIEDISQTVLQEYFVMIMMVDLSDCAQSLPQLSEILAKAGEAAGVQIRIQHQGIFDAMHKI